MMRGLKINRMKQIFSEAIWDLLNWRVCYCFDPVEVFQIPWSLVDQIRYNINPHKPLINREMMNLMGLFLEMKFG